MDTIADDSDEEVTRVGTPLEETKESPALDEPDTIAKKSAQPTSETVVVVDKKR
jgi:hypothetical protein